MSSPLDQHGMVALPAPESGSARLRPAALPHELKSHSREAETRTPSAWTQTRNANPYATSRQWRWQESNPLRQRLQGAPATLAVIPRCPQDGACGPYLVLTLLS